MADSIANASDSELVQIATTVINATAGAPGDFGLTALQVTELTARRDTFNDDLAAHLTAQATAKSMTRENRSRCGSTLGDEVCSRPVRHFARNCYRGGSKELPGSEKECVFLTLDAFTPYLAEYDAVDSNKTAHYMVRWRLRDGSVSAWGETISATITG